MVPSIEFRLFQFKLFAFQIIDFDPTSLLEKETNRANLVKTSNHGRMRLDPQPVSISREKPVPLLNYASTFYPKLPFLARIECFLNSFRYFTFFVFGCFLWLPNKSPRNRPDKDHRPKTPRILFFSNAFLFPSKPREIGRGREQRIAPPKLETGNTMENFGSLKKGGKINSTERWEEEE